MLCGRRSRDQSDAVGDTPWRSSRDAGPLRGASQADHHRSALAAAANLADRYVNDRFLPDKAIDLIDEAGARLRIRRLTAPPELKEFDARIEETRKKKEEAIDGQDFELAASLRDEEQKLKTEREEKEKAWRHGECSPP